MVLENPPVCLYILESESTKTFYASHVFLKYKKNIGGRIKLTSGTKRFLDRYPEMIYVRNVNGVSWGINKFYSDIINKSKTDEKINDLLKSKYKRVTGFLFNCKGYAFRGMEGYEIQKIYDTKMEDIHKIIYEFKELYKDGYMEWEYFEEEIQKTIYGRTFLEMCTNKRWTYLKRNETYECINKRNLGKTEQQKNKTHYEKKKEDKKFVYNTNRKQCLRDIKKNNKRPSQKTIDKYKLTESEINLSACVNKYKN